MSTATELAEAEARRAEAESGTDEPAPATDEEEEEEATEPEAAAGEPSKAQLRELDDEQRRHERRVHEVMDEFVAGFVACESCSGVGLVPPVPQPKEHEFFRRCQTCNGYGKVLTGSLDEQNRARDCPSCKGRGYLERLTEAGLPLADSASSSSAPVIAATQVDPATGELVTPTEGGERVFGTPSWMGNPDLGAQ